MAAKKDSIDSVQNYMDVEPDKRPDLSGAAQVTEVYLRSKEGKQKISDGVIWKDQYQNYWDISARNE